MKSFRIYPILLIAALVLQVCAPHQVQAAFGGQDVQVLATGGPVEQLRFPMNGAVTVPNIQPRIEFAQTIKLVAGGASNISLWESGAGGDTRISAVAEIDSSNKAIEIKPQDLLLPGRNYYVLIQPDTVYDYVSGNYYDGMTSNSDWHFTVESLEPISLTPFNSNVVDFNGITLTMTFDRGMVAGQGTIQLKRSEDNVTEETFAIRPQDVVVNGTNTVVTVTSTKKIQPNTAYYVFVDPGAVRDAAGNPYAGIASRTRWTFATKPALDTTPPKIKTLTPANGGTLGALTGPISVEFDKAVVAGSGNVTIRTTSNGAVFCTLPVNSAGVSFAGGVMTLSPTAYACPAFANNSNYYVEIGSQAVRDTSGNYYAGLSGSTAWRFATVQDVTPPVITALSPANGATNVSTSTTQFSLTFNEPVRLSSGAAAQLNTAQSTAAASLAIALDPSNNRRVLLTVPTNALASAGNYYITVPNTAITDAAGNVFPGILNNSQWTFRTLNVNSVPALLKAETDGSAIVLTYSEALDPSKVPYASNYFVVVNDTMAAVSYVTISGSTVRLALQQGVMSGQAVRVSYYPDNQSTARRVQNTVGREALSFSNQNVVNEASSSLPKPESGVYSGAVISMTFNRSMMALAPGYENQFTVKVGGSTVPVSTSYSSGNVLYLVIGVGTAGSATISVSYAPGAAPLRDQSGNFVTAFTDFFVRNGDDSRPPQLVSGTVTGNKLTIVYDEGLSTLNVPPASSFSVLAGGVQVMVNSVAIVNNTVELTLAQSVAENTAVLLYYYLGGNTLLTDLSNNIALPIAAYPLVAGSAAGTAAGISSATVSGNRLTLQYATVLSPAIIPYVTQYTVRFNGTVIGVTNVSVSGSQVVLSLGTQVAAGQTVTVSYSTTGVALRDALNKSVVAFTNLSVQNQGGSGNGGAALPDYAESDGEGGMSLILSKTTTTIGGTTSSGASGTRYIVDGDKLLAAYAFIRSTGTGITVPRVTITVPVTNAGGMVSIPFHALMEAVSKVSNGSFRIAYGDYSFELPLTAVNYNREMYQAGGSVDTSNLLIDIGKATSSELTSAINIHSAQLLATAADFRTSIGIGGNVKEIKTYESYVTRSFLLANTSSNSSQVSVVRYDQDARKLTYVPTFVGSSASGGKSKISFKHKGNGIYTVVQKNTVFTDMTNHWARSGVALLANKFIVDGDTRTTFAPSRNITRADFAIYIARGLGLDGDKSAAARYSDVGVQHEAASFIGAASKAGIIEGSTDGTFRPGAPITREEMATILVRAMNYAGVQTTANPSSLNSFKDKSSISNWALNGVTVSVTAGFIKGTDDKKINPKSNATRAEAAVMIVRFLEYVELL